MRIDVGCNEVCQCCAHRFMLASQFLRHTPNVLQMDDDQAAYVTDRRERMVKRVDNELRLAESKKRSREAEDACMDVPKRTKLTEACAAPTGGQHGTASLQQPGFANIHRKSLGHDPSRVIRHACRDIAARSRSDELRPNIGAMVRRGKWSRHI
jgi:hypothetical protein